MPKAFFIQNDIDAQNKKNVHKDHLLEQSKGGGGRSEQCMRICSVELVA